MGRRRWGRAAVVQQPAGSATSTGQSLSPHAACEGGNRSIRHPLPGSEPIQPLEPPGPHPHRQRPTHLEPSAQHNLVGHEHDGLLLIGLFLVTPAAAPLLPPRARVRIRLRLLTGNGSPHVPPPAAEPSCHGSELSTSWHEPPMSRSQPLDTSQKPRTCRADRGCRLRRCRHRPHSAARPRAPDPRRPCSKYRSQTMQAQAQHQGLQWHRSSGCKTPGPTDSASGVSSKGAGRRMAGLPPFSPCACPKNCQCPGSQSDFGKAGPLLLGA